MNKKLKDKWIKALRSGEYEQGTMRLVTAGKRYDEFCCLGVLADVAGAEWNEYMEPCIGDEVVGSQGRLDLGYFKLPGKVEEHLVNMNDTGKSFKQIANWIEKNV